jgi:predicted secreted hydrolase
MAQKYPKLTASEAESILESTAIPMLAGSRTFTDSNGSPVTLTWEIDATGSGLVDAAAALEKLNP